MSKHTPGPWRRQGMIIWGAQINRAVARLYTTTGEPLQDNANARLIAAAPELLAACKLMIAAIGKNAIEDWGDPYHKQMVDAVAKAEGK